jgi:hypothetical protein
MPNADLSETHDPLALLAPLDSERKSGYRMRWTARCTRVGAAPPRSRRGWVSDLRGRVRGPSGMAARGGRLCPPRRLRCALSSFRLPRLHARCGSRGRPRIASRGGCEQFVAGSAVSACRSTRFGRLSATEWRTRCCVLPRTGLRCEPHRRGTGRVRTSGTATLGGFAAVPRGGRRVARNIAAVGRTLRAPLAPSPAAWALLVRLERR